MDLIHQSILYGYFPKKQVFLANIFYHAYALKNMQVKGKLLMVKGLCPKCGHEKMKLLMLNYQQQLSSNIG